MNFLLFFVCGIYAVIFHFFYTKSIGKDFFLNPSTLQSNYFSLSGNILIETLFFLVLGAVLYIVFSDFSSSSDEAETHITFEDVKNFLKKFFKKYLYYVGFFLFYFSLFLIFRELGFTFSYIILLVNFVIFSMFFLSSKFYIFRDFIKVNTILFSLFYISKYIYSFITWQIAFIEIDFINSFFVLIFFILTIYSDNFILKKKHSDTAITTYFFIYLFLFVSFYFYLVFSSLTLTLAFMSFVFSFVCYFLAPKLELFHDSIIPLRYLSLVFSYTGIGATVWYGYKHWFSMFPLVILLFSSYFNFFIHRKYFNLISLGWCFAAIGYFAFYLYMIFVSSTLWLWQYMVSYFFIVSALVILVPITYKSKEIMEYYMYHIFSYIFNIVWVVYYFLLSWFDIFHFWVILLIESVFVFFSYYQINLLKKKQ